MTRLRRSVTAERPRPEARTPGGVSVPVQTIEATWESRLPQTVARGGHYRDIRHNSKSDRYGSNWGPKQTARNMRKELFPGFARRWCSDQPIVKATTANPAGLSQPSSASLTPARSRRCTRRCTETSRVSVHLADPTFDVRPRRPQCRPRPTAQVRSVKGIVQTPVQYSLESLRPKAGSNGKTQSGAPLSKRSRPMHRDCAEGDV